MKSFALMSIIACANALTEAGAEQFTEGFLDGVFGTVEGAVKCIRDLPTIGYYAEWTIDDFKPNSYHYSIYKAIELIGIIARNLGFDIANCY